jgi:hypothetical protein
MIVESAERRKIMMYIPGIAFLFLASAVIAIPFAMSRRRTWLAILFPVCLSTFILNVWAYFDMGGFDLGFLIIQAITGLCAGATVNMAVDQIRSRTHNR